MHRPQRPDRSLARGGGALLCLLLGGVAAWLGGCSAFDLGRYSNYIGPAGAGGATRRVAQAGRRAPAARPPGPIAVSVREAILLALENNRELAVERLQPAVAATYEGQERAAFDPIMVGEFSSGRQKRTRLSRAGSGTESSISDSLAAALSLEAFLPTGTTVSLEASYTETDSSLYANPLASTRYGLNVTQALLQGADLAANLASLRQARIDTRISEYELRGFAEALAADVEGRYWDFALAKRQIEIYTDSLRLAEKQLKETGERVTIGALAETELAAAKAEVALRKEGLINARSELAQIRLRLLRLLNPAGPDLWSRPIVLRDRPVAPDVQLDDVDKHVQVAMRMRADLNEARLEVQREELEVVKTRNGLLPKLDLFATLGKTGYSRAFAGSLPTCSGDGYDALVGARLSYPPVNRDARARHRRAVLTRQQLTRAVENLAQLVEVDVRAAYIELRRAREQMAATAATRALQEEKLRVETEKFRVGKSTSLLVAAAQRDLLESRIAEIQAVVNYLKSIVDLCRLDGSYLVRLGVAAPGEQPAAFPGGGP